MRKITILLITAFMAFAYAGWSQVFITELADPNNASGARFVELYNAGASSVDLSTGWDLQRWTNANTAPQTAKELTGSIPAGGFYIVCANQTTFTSTYGFAADQSIGTGGPADSNGDDQIALRDPSDVIVDMFGVPGEDGSNTNHEFEDGRAERKSTVTSGNSTYTFSEWNIWNDTGGAGTTNLPQNAPADFDPGAWIGTSSSPIISIAPSALSGLNYAFGSGPSSTQTFTVEGSDLTADISVNPSTNYEISSDNVTFQLSTITLTQSGGTVTPTTLYTRLQAGLSAGNYTEDIIITSTGATDKTVACSGTVEVPATTTLTYSETFDTGFGDCYTYSVAGVNAWYHYAGGQLVNMNGFGGSNPEEDWLVLPGINLDNYSNEIMTFTTSAKYGTVDANNYLKLYYSTNYAGVGDPSTATWVELTYNQPTGINNSTEVSAFSGNIDLSGISGTSVYIAFKYYSTNSPTRWGVDDILIGEALSYYNLQWPPSGAINSWWNYTVYAQCWEGGVTDSPGQGAGIECWIGYSLVDEDPDGSANFTWVMANYDSDQGNNDQYSTNLGADVPMAPGTYYYVSRWRFNNGPYTYGGFNSGAWDGTTNVSGVLTINASAAASTWTGAVDNNWFDAGNWDNGIPGYITDATIPAGLTNYPVIPSGTALCGTLLVQSGAAGSGSIVETSLNVVGSTTVERYLSADQYHTFSPSVGGELIDIFHLNAGEPDVYLYENNEATYDYTELFALGTPLNAYQGYMVWVDGANAGGVTGWTFSETGALNTGLFGAADNLVRTTTGFNSGWNLLGNPYPSALDWQSAYTASGANVDATVYVYNGTQWASWSTTGSVNGGSQYIAMGQGFFVNCSTPGTGTFMVDYADRVNNNVGYMKSEVSNKVSLQVEGNGYTDETAIIFNDAATAGFDSDFDAYKLMSDHPGVPSLYSIASTNLAVNVLPETNWVQLGFSAGVSGEFTISAIEINDIGIVVLEDTFTGEMTDLTSSSYTFDYTLNDNEQRFIIHFSPLSVGENTDKLFTVYSVNNEVVVVAPENTDGQINIYNMMGQEVIATQINGTINTIALEKSAYYVVKVLSNNNMTTRKVFIK